nr:bacterial transcriptional activator domain-containing protein [Pseudonocardia acidicola]
MTLVRGLPERPAPDLAEIEPLCADILPSWTSSWIAVERERFRQIRLHALEELSLQLTAAGRHDDAIEVGQAAVRAAPSRESARRVLIEAHLAQGNIAAAVAAYDEYQELLRSSIGGPVASALDSILPPSPAWPVVRGFRRPVQRSAVALPGLRSIRNAPTFSRRLVTGGSVPGTAR